MEFISNKVLKDVNKILKLNNGGFIGMILCQSHYNMEHQKLSGAVVTLDPRVCHDLHPRSYNSS